MRISLEDDEQFIVKPPRGGRTFKICLIEVHQDGSFFVFGDNSWRKNQPDNCTEVPYGYRRVGEVPTMPPAVAEEVQRCIKHLKIGRLVA